MNLQENIFRIKQIMGLLNEQVSGNLVGNNVYQAIKNIESVFGFIDKNGKIKDRKDLDGTENEALIRRVIGSSIGLDTWAKLDPKLKGQIYSFMFQADSGVRDPDTNELVKDTRFRWLAGLAQSIDPSIDRKKIVDKELNNSYVQNVIEFVKKNIDKIEYASYVNVVKDQYNNITNDPYTAEKRLYIWGQRPDALDKLMNGEPWSAVEKWWWDKVDPKKEREENPNKTTGGATSTGTQTDTTGTQPATTGGATSTNPQPQPATTGGETPTTSTPTQTTAKPYPNIDNPFTPRNGDPWKYAYDGTNLIVKSPTTGNEYNLNDPNYFTTYPYSKLKNEEQLNNAIASIKNAYGEKLGM